jgi:hypothetical protein
MKTTSSASVLAMFVVAIPSLIMPASALSAEESLRPRRDPASFDKRLNDRDRADTLRSDPIMKSPWGPGDASLAVPKFHFKLGFASGATALPPIATRDDQEKAKVHFIR